MGDGTKENPFTREDVLRLLEGNGGTAAGLNLSGKTFEEGIDLHGLELEGIILKDAGFPTHFEGQELVGAKFNGSNLNRADFRNVNLQYAQFAMLNNQLTRLESADLRGTILLNANFQGAELSCAKFGREEDENFRPAALENTDFRNAYLFRTNFIGCYFYGTKLEGAFIRGADIFDAHLEEVDWGNYKIGEEEKKDFYSAVHYYRRLKVWYTQKGYYDIAAKFYYREKEARRKSIQNIMHMLLKQRECRTLLKLLLKQDGGWTLLWLWIYRLLCGYGEKTLRIIGWTSLVIFGLAAAYYFWGSFSSSSFWDTLYYSATSFSALGYGNWAPQPTGWAKGMGAAEAIIGVSMMALFLVTFVRKMTR